MSHGASPLPALSYFVKWQRWWYSGSVEWNKGYQGGIDSVWDVHGVQDRHCQYTIGKEDAVTEWQYCVWGGVNTYRWRCSNRASSIRRGIVH